MTKVLPGKRKKQAAPKVRTGCLTCKGRHIKCTEEKPECLQCTSTGRKCEGYRLAVEVWSGQPKVSNPRPPTLRTPSSNAFEANELRSLRFFLDRTIAQITSPFSQGLWSHLVPAIAQYEPSIKHALIALSEFHERFMSSTRSHVELGKSALKHYNYAIRELLSPGKTTVSPVIGLLCCLLFFATELLQGNIASAIQLFQAGRRMIYELRNGVLRARQPGSYHELFGILKAAFIRSEYHVMGYFVKLGSDLSFTDCYGSDEPDCTSADEKSLLAPVAIFNSLPQALEALRRVSYGIVNKTLSHDSNPQDDQQAFTNWRTAFESLKETIPKPYTDMDKMTIVGLEIWWRQVLLYLLTVSDAPQSASPMWWDQHQALLVELLDYLEEIIRIQCANLGSSISAEKPSPPSFCMEPGMVTHITTIITRCRDPYVRRRAIALLKMYNRQEGLLQRQLTIDSCQRIIDLEERGLAVTRAADIPLEARIVQSCMEFHTDEPKVVIKHLIDKDWVTEVMSWSPIQ